MRSWLIRRQAMYVPFICPHPQNCLQQKSKRSEMQKMKLLSCSKQHTDLKEVSDTLVIPCLCWCVLPYYINFFSSRSFYNSNKVTVYHKLNSHEKKFFETMCHLSNTYLKLWEERIRLTGHKSIKTFCATIN